MRRIFIAATAALLFPAMLFTACGSADVNKETNAASSSENNDINAGSETDIITEKEIDRSAYDFSTEFDGALSKTLSSGAAVHDPSILKCANKYYIYGSHMAAASSDDLISWKPIANGYSKGNPIFGQIYSVYDEAFAYAGSPDSIIPTDNANVGGEHVWAPDVIYNKAMGKYVMYYCTTSTWNASNLCYGISDSPEGPFEWQGPLIYSGYDKDTISYTDILDYVDEDHAITNYLKGSKYRFEDWPNAIDPNAFYDRDGKMWLVYGSWSGGIFLLEIDESTGKVIHPEADPGNNVDAYYGKRLAGGGHMSMEAPYILWDETSGYYYLFVSYGGLNREGGYQIRVFRSREPDGDYLDMNDKKLEKGLNNAYYGLKLSGNYMLPSLTKAYMATGHNSAFIDTDGKKYIVYHTRFDNGSEGHSPRVHQFIVNADGWPCMLPYQTHGETVSANGYSKEELAGRYYMIDQGTAINAEIAQPGIIYLNEDGTAVTENGSGTWDVSDGTYYMTLDLENRTYTGVFCAMEDEAGTPVMTFSAVGFNESVWGVKYIE